MRFHLIGDYRIPPNPKYIHDSYNSKIFRFIDLLSCHHKIIVYGPSGHGKYFKHPNVDYCGIIKFNRYKNIDVYHPDIMLANTSNDPKLCALFDENAKKAILKNYQIGDIVVTTTTISKLPSHVICVNYSVGCYYSSQEYATLESNFLQQHIKNLSLSFVINPYFRVNDFPTLDIQRESSTYLFMGRCSSSKGLARFMIIADYFREHHKSGTFIIAGASIKSEPDTLYMSGLNNIPDYVYDLKLKSNVQYVGIADRTLRNILYRRATCLIQLSEYDEPCGYNIIEAQFCGCPVIASNRGALRENIIHGKTGFLTNDTHFPYELSYKSILNTLKYIDEINIINSSDCIKNVLSFFDKHAIYKDTMNAFNQIQQHHIQQYHIQQHHIQPIHSDDHHDIQINMKTIHTNIRLSSTGIDILRQLYDAVLQYDDKFHYFWEPYLIIRMLDVSVQKIIDCININFPQCVYYTYDYPICKDPKLPKGMIVHIENGIVLKYTQFFIQLFHGQSISGLIMPYNDQQLVRERIIHTLYNQHHIVGGDEVEELGKLSKARDMYNKINNI
jgi:glycosyltransferase involved in cell wall biosynthesis